MSLSRFGRLVVACPDFVRRDVMATGSGAGEQAWVRVHFEEAALGQTGTPS